MSKSYFVEQFFGRTNICGFHNCAYGGCCNYHITALNNYHIFSSRWEQIFLKKLKLSKHYRYFL